MDKKLLMIVQKQRWQVKFLSYNVLRVLGIKNKIVLHSTVGIVTNNINNNNNWYI